MTAMERWLLNGQNLLTYAKNIFVGVPRTVSMTWYNADGTTTEYSSWNIPKLFDDIKSLVLGQFNQTFYVDEVNGDDSNSGISSAPLKNIHTAFSKIPNGGKAVIILLSDCSYSQDVSKYGIIAEVRLNGHKLSLVKTYAEGKAILFSLIGYGNTVYFTGQTQAGSALELPALGSDTLFSTGHSVFIKSKGILEPEFSFVHFGYGVELVDNGDFYISTCAGSTCVFSVAGCTFTQNNGSRDWVDLVSGVIRDADSGNPINLLSNLNFSS